jgi:hypothetical protein
MMTIAQNAVNLSSAHSTQVEQAGRYMNVLQIVGTLAAVKLHQQLSGQLALTAQAVAEATQAKDQAKSIKARAGETEADLQTLLEAAPAMVRTVEPAAVEKLPSRESFPSTDPDTYAHAVAGALEAAGPALQPYAHAVDKARKRRLAALREYEELFEHQAPVQKGRAALSDLSRLFMEAESLLRSTVPPGSPLFLQLKAPKQPKAAKAGGAKAGEGKSAEAKGDASPATSDVSAPVVKMV